MEKQWHARRQNNPGRQKPPISTVYTKLMYLNVDCVVIKIIYILGKYCKQS